MSSKQYSFLFVFIILLGAIGWANRGSYAATAATCQSFFGDAIPEQSSVELSFFCNQEVVTYFGVCDSGSVADDLFELRYQGEQVSYNYFEGERERVVVLTGIGNVGFNSVTLRSLNKTTSPPATFAYAISSDFTQVQNFLFEFCGTDYTGIGAICSRDIQIFIDGVAPTTGTLVMMGRFGELNRMEGITFAQYRVDEGAVVNNVVATGRGPTYIRMWWKPANEDNWYLLPSQYWRGGGTVASEYGLGCDSSGSPSYDTAWNKRIIDKNVPLLDINNDGKIEIIPTVTAWAQQTATAQAGPSATATPNP